MNLLGGALVFIASIMYSYGSFLSKKTKQHPATFKWHKFIRTAVIGLIAGGFVAVGNVSASTNIVHNAGVGLSGGLVTVLADQGSKGVYRLLNGFQHGGQGN